MVKLLIMIRVFYDSDADLSQLATERIAVLGYGIQGSAQAQNLRDGGFPVIIGNRPDAYREQAEADGFAVYDLEEASRRATLILLLVPDEVQAEVFHRSVRPQLEVGDALCLAHGFALRYQQLEIPDDIDVVLLAPRMPGRYVRQRFQEGWGVPAYVSVEQDATGRGLERLLALARALGITRCGAIQVSAELETELDLFSEHFLFPLVFSALETAFECLVEAGYPPEVAVMELHGSGELGELLVAASRDGLYPMIDSHASPACQVGLAQHWESSLENRDAVRQRINSILDRIRDGRFAKRLLEEAGKGYPELQAWRRRRSKRLLEAEAALRTLLRRR